MWRGYRELGGNGTGETLYKKVLDLPNKTKGGKIVMDLSFITENFVPVIVVACLIVGYVIKVTPLFNKVANAYIPLIVAALGAILGGVMNGIDGESIVYGAVSGLASTGLHQMFSKLLNLGGNE